MITKSSSVSLSEKTPAKVALHYHTNAPRNDTVSMNILANDSSAFAVSLHMSPEEARQLVMAILEVLP